MNSQLTRHASIRLQQRGIPPGILDPLLAYGHKAHDHRGGTVVYFDHQARKRLKRALEEGQYRRVERHLDAYAVIAGDGAILTVGHRTRRICRD